MKNLFTLPMEIKPGERMFFQKYEVRAISKETEQEITKMNTRIADFQKQYKKTYSKIYSVTSFLFMVCLFFGIVMLFQTDKTTGFVFIGVSLIFLIVTMLLMKADVKKSKEIQNSQEYIDLGIEGENLIKKAYDELKLEKNNNEVDIYLNYYQEKDGKIVSALPYSAFMSKEYLISKDEENLILGDIYSVIHIPLSKIGALEKVDHAYTFYGWNKKELPNVAPYKEYGIKNINGSMFFKAKGYYVLKLDLEGKEVGIYIAPYDVEKIKNLLNL